MFKSKESAKLVDLGLRQKGMVLGTCIGFEMACQALKEATGKDCRELLVLEATRVARQMTMKEVNQELAKIDTALSLEKPPLYHRWKID